MCEDDWSRNWSIYIPSILRLIFFFYCSCYCYKIFPAFPGDILFPWTFVVLNVMVICWFTHPWKAYISCGRTVLLHCLYSKVLFLNRDCCLGLQSYCAQGYFVCSVGQNHSSWSINQKVKKREITFINRFNWRCVSVYERYIRCHILFLLSHMALAWTTAHGACFYDSGLEKDAATEKTTERKLNTNTESFCRHCTWKVSSGCILNATFNPH